MGFQTPEVDAAVVRGPRRDPGEPGILRGPIWPVERLVGTPAGHRGGAGSPREVDGRGRGREVQGRALRPRTDPVRSDAPRPPVRSVRAPARPAPPAPSRAAGARR